MESASALLVAQQFWKHKLQKAWAEVAPGTWSFTATRTGDTTLTAFPCCYST